MMVDKDNVFIEVLLLNDLLGEGAIDQAIYTKALQVIRKDHPEVGTNAA